jgi:hypothetical protein
MLTAHQFTPAFGDVVPVSLFRRWMTYAQRDIERDGEIRPAIVRFAGMATDEERRALRLARLHDDMKQHRAHRRRVRQQIT